MFVKLPSRPGIRLIILGIFIGVLLFWVMMDWPCLFRAVTGIPCIGCGLSRAWLAALQLDLASAFRYHPMFWSVPLLILLAFFDGKLLRKELWNRILVVLLLVGLVVCYIIRLVVYLRGDFVF